MVHKFFGLVETVYLWVRNALYGDTSLAGLNSSQCLDSLVEISYVKVAYQARGSMILPDVLVRVIFL